MAYAFIQQKENSSASAAQGSIGSNASGSNLTNNSVLPWVVEYYSPAVKTITFGDTRGLSFVECGNFYSVPNGEGKRWGYALVGSNGGATETVTATFSANVDFPGIIFGEYSGLDPTAPFTSGEAVGQIQSAPGTGTDAITTGNTPALATQPCMVYGLCSDITVGFAPTAGTGFTSRTVVWATSDSQARPQDKRVTATTAVAATWTSQASHGTDAYSSCVMVFKEAVAGGTTTTKTMTDTVAVTDQEIDFIRFKRVMDEALVLADNIVKTLVLAGATTYTKVMSDTLAATDAVVQWLRRVRGPIDTITLGDGDTYRTSIITTSEALDVTDGFTLFRRYRRVAQDTLDIIDAFSKTLSGAGITYAKVMSDTVTVIDDAGRRWRLRFAQLTDTVGLSDQVIRSLRAVRSLGDVVEFSDGTTKVRRTIRSMDESIEVSDERISTLYLDQVSNTSFAFGSSGPPFRFGGM